jgi:glutamate dehydrogenase/leucine dehydrogenase
MDDSFAAVWKIMMAKKVNPRLAAYILAVDRVVQVMKLRGR